MKDLEAAAYKIVLEALESSDWTVGEKAVIKWQFRMWGRFYTTLFEVISIADDENLAKLRLAFPDEVDGFIAWNRGDLGKRLEDAGLPI